jgi:hypothetical protein
MTVERLEPLAFPLLPAELQRHAQADPTAQPWRVHFVESRFPQALLWFPRRAEALLLDQAGLHLVPADTPYLAAQSWYGPLIPYASDPQKNTSW